MAKIPLRRLLSKLTVLALSASPGVAVAQTAAGEDCDLDGDASIDRDDVDLRDASLMLGQSLAVALGELAPIARTHLATSWALSADPLRRAAIAKALQWRFPLFGDCAIVEHLAADPDPLIRGAIAGAAHSRGFAEIAHRLVDDVDPQVRAIARLKML